MPLESLIILILVFVGFIVVGWKIKSNRIFSTRMNWVLQFIWAIVLVIFILMCWDRFGIEKIPNPISGPKADIPSSSPEPAHLGFFPIVKSKTDRPDWNEEKQKHKDTISTFKNP